MHYDYEMILYMIPPFLYTHGCTLSANLYARAIINYMPVVQVQVLRLAPICFSICLVYVHM